ncbi:hypothetical protein HPB52_014481 [Rhipicephalus sanguineus]|uniref:Uncharacterized protein n=1 Tax=Rhipicephalus sanguineus TaxID=34632 RepID=A0A9D4SV18_RHISA|nr:hypothetical protein HPB52_014481 [Rhipicephalus sanguineus]
MTADYFEAKGVRVPTAAEGRWAALVARQTVSPAQVQGEAEVFGERKDEDGGGQTGEALVVEPAENESASDLLAVPTAECGLTLGPDEETHQPPSPSVVFVSGATPECVSGKPSDRDDRDQDSAPRERKRLQLKLRSVPVEANTETATMSKAPELAPKGSSSIFGGARPVDTAAREREIEARLSRQRKEKRRQIRHREPFQDSRKEDQEIIAASSAAATPTTSTPRRARKKSPARKVLTPARRDVDTAATIEDVDPSLPAAQPLPQQDTSSEDSFSLGLDGSIGLSSVGEFDVEVEAPREMKRGHTSTSCSDEVSDGRAEAQRPKKSRPSSGGSNCAS